MKKYLNFDVMYCAVCLWASLLGFAGAIWLAVYISLVFLFVSPIFVVFTAMWVGFFADAIREAQYRAGVDLDE